jgi:hypothetical protein
VPLRPSTFNSNRSLAVDLDIFFGAAVGDREHDAEAGQYNDADHGPRCTYAFQNAQLLQRGQQSTDEDHEANQIHARPFHDCSADKTGYF